MSVQTENPGFKPATLLGMVVRTLNPRAWEAEAGGSVSPQDYRVMTLNNTAQTHTGGSGEPVLSTSAEVHNFRMLQQL